jgi:hypothetical protein
MKRIPILKVCAVSIIACLSFGAQGQIITDSTFVHHQILDGIDNAEYIFEGEVLSVKSFYNPANNFIYTSNTVLVNQSWKDHNKPIKPREIVEIITRGGTVGDDNLWISHNLGFAPGQKGMFLCQTAIYPSDPTSTTPLAKQLQVHDGLYFDYDFTRNYFSASYSSFNFECIDLLYRTIDSTYVAECLDVWPIGYLQIQKYEELSQISESKAAGASLGSAVVTLTFDNPATVEIGGEQYFEFDIDIAASSSGSFFFDNIPLRLAYNQTAFGTNIFDNNNITVERGEVMFSMVNYYDPMPSPITLTDGITLGIGIVATAVIGATERFQIGTTPQQLVRVRLKIVDCSALPQLSFEVTSFTADFTLYTTTAAGTNLLSASTVIANDTENSVLCPMEITGFNPLVLDGGVGDILTITGTGFGANGTIEMKNSNINGGSWITLDPYDIVSWSNTQIQVRVPSTGPITAANGDDTWTPGTGIFKVNNSLTGSMEESDQPVQIHYSRRNYQVFNPNLNPPTLIKGKGHLIGIDPVLNEENNMSGMGYQLNVSEEIFNNSSAMICIRQALHDWSCLTGIRWTVAEEPTSTFVINDGICTLRFGEILTSNTIAETRVFLDRCAGSQGGATEVGLATDFDIVFEPVPDGNPWFYDATGDLLQPAGEYDFYSLVLHELGHAHLFRHVIDEQDIMHGLNSVFNPNNSTPANNRRIIFSQSNSDGGNEIVTESSALNLGFCSQLAFPEQHDPMVLINCDLGLSTSLPKDESIKLLAHPNPSNGLVHINFNVAYPSTSGRISLQSIQGKVLMSENYMINSGDSTILLDMELLPAGIYIFQLELNEMLGTIKIVRQ